MTPAQLKDYAFTKSFKGYNATEVDSFMDGLIENYASLYSENALLAKKIDLLVEQVEKYREEEDTLRCAIINAQKMGDSIIKDAQGRAELMLRDAQIKSDKIVATCRHSVEEQKVEYDRLRHEISDFREKIMTTYHRHLDIIQELPAYEEEAPEKVKAAFAEEAAAEEVKADLTKEEEMDAAVAAKLAKAVAEAEETLQAEKAAQKEENFSEPKREEPTIEEKVDHTEDTREFDSFAEKPREKKEPIPEGQPLRSVNGELLFGEDYDLDEDWEKPKKKGFFKKKD